VSASYRHCRHCGDAVPHDAPAAICGRCACLSVAERGRGMPPPIPGSGLGLPPIGGALTASDWGMPEVAREPGSDDDRQPTRCVHCSQVGSGNPCPRCELLIRDIDQPAPAPETEEARRERLHVARVAHIQASWERGKRCLLARALDPANQEWARCEPRGIR
jgi:hypothetical protein